MFLCATVQGGVSPARVLLDSTAGISGGGICIAFGGCPICLSSTGWCRQSGGTSMVFCNGLPLNLELGVCVH